MEAAQLITFEAQLSGVVNNQEVNLTGQGTIDESNGITKGFYDLSLLHAEFPRCILTSCLITGYPNASSTPLGLSNPFKGKSYEYRRSIYFDSGHLLRYKTSVEVGRNMLLSRFTLSGSAPKFTSATEFSQTIYETWIDQSDPSIEGRFTAKWSSRNNDHITGECETEYRVSDYIPFSPAKRIIYIVYNEEDSCLKLVQNSRLSK